MAKPDKYREERPMVAKRATGAVKGKGRILKKDEKGTPIRGAGRSTASKPGRKTFAKGEINPKAPKTPEDRVHKNRPICGAPRSGNSASGPGICCQAAGWGTNHVGVGLCAFHGGNTPSHVKKHDRERAAEQVAMFGLPRDIDPQTALLEEVQRTAGHIDWLKDLIQALEDPKALTQFTDAGIQPSVWIEMYQKERAHLVTVSSAAIKCGVAERQVRIAEEQGRLLAMVLQAFIRDPELQLTPRQLAFAPKIIRKHILTAPVDFETADAAQQVNDVTPAKAATAEVIDV